MATSQVVTIAVGSEFGFKRPATAPVPIMETVKSFNTATTIEGTRATTSSKVISISTLSEFVFPIGNTATSVVKAQYGVGYIDYLRAWTQSFKKALIISNVGNSDVTMFPNPPYRPQFSFPTSPGVEPVLHSINGVVTNTSTFVIPPGTTSSVEIAYYGTDIGDYSSYVSVSNVNSDTSINTITIFTNQIVLESTFDFTLSTSTFVNYTTILGSAYTTVIDVTPVYNGVPNPNTPLDFSTSLIGDAGWKYTTGTNQITLTWDPDYVNNSTGTYRSTLTVYANETTHIIQNTSYVSIDYSKYQNLATWTSPAAPYNSVIGMSLDLVNGNKVLTIGVGTGADGSPIYANGGSAFAEVYDLGFNASTIDTPYPYWAEVYSFTLTDNVPTTQLSGEKDPDGKFKYFVKPNADAAPMGQYFGYEQSPGYGSMFIVDHDGTGNVTVEINNLRELSGDDQLDTTLNNLTRAFYYYSEVDNPPRYYQLDGPIKDGTVGYLFRGFSASYSPGTFKWSWAPEISVVALPT
jgi:hypothetical protein